MRLPLNTQGRIWILLAAWILFTGLSVADTFDLSDDIVLPTAFGHLAVTPASVDERKPHVLSANVFIYGGESNHLSLIGDGDVSLFSSLPCFGNATPLYQRHSVYRI